MHEVVSWRNGAIISVRDAQSLNAYLELRPHEVTMLFPPEYVLELIRARDRSRYKFQSRRSALPIFSQCSQLHTATLASLLVTECCARRYVCGMPSQK